MEKTQKIDKYLYWGLLVMAVTMVISVAANSFIWVLLLILWLVKMIVKKDYSFINTSLDRPILLLLGLTYISTLVAISPGDSFKQFKQISLVTIYWLLINNIKNIEQIKKIVYTFIIVTTLAAILGIIQYILGINMIDGQIVYNPHPGLGALSKSMLRYLSLVHGRAWGPRSHPLTFAEGLMMAITLAFPILLFTPRVKTRIWLSITIFLMGLSLIFTNSRGPWLGTLIGLTSIIFIKSSKKVATALLFSLIVMAIVVLGIAHFSEGQRNPVLDRIQSIKNWQQDVDSRERVFMWQSGVKMIIDHPFWGIGLGNISKVYPIYKSPLAWHKGVENELHSNFIQIAVERGLLALGAFLWLIVVFWREAYRSLKDLGKEQYFTKALLIGGIVSMVSFIVAGFTETTYNDSEIITMMYFLMGITMWIRHNEFETKNQYHNFKKVAVFMDRDGTISEEIGYITQPDKFKLLPRSAEAIKLLNKNGIRSIVVTNQSGVARGYFSEETVMTINKKMEDLLAKDGAKLDAIYYCPHRPEDNCTCRKPKPGNLEKSAQEFKLDLKKCFVVGDKYTDIEFGHNVGAKSILVLTGYGKGQWEYEKNQWYRQPDFVAGDLLEAVEWIIKQLTD